MLPAVRAPAVCMLCADIHVMLSVCVCTTPVYVFASQSGAPQGRLKNPKIKSGLYTKFQDQVFLLDFESRCMCVGILDLYRDLCVLEV